MFCLHGICPHVWPNQRRNPVLPCLHLSLVEIHTKLPVCFLIPQDLWYTEDTSQCRIAIWRSISTSPWHVLLSNSALYSKLADHSLFDNAMRKIDVGLNHYTWLPCILQVPMIKRKKMWRKNAPHRPWHSKTVRRIAKETDAHHCGPAFFTSPAAIYMFPPSFSCILPLAMTLPALVGRISNWAEPAMERPSAGGTSPCGRAHSTQAW